MTVWLVIAKGVYDQGCFGVFSTVDAAQTHALHLWNGSDGYHTLRIESFVVDFPVPDAVDEWMESTLGGSESDATTTKRRRLAEEKNGGHPWIRLLDHTEET